MSDREADKPLVLIADDDPDMRVLVRRALSSLDADFVEATNGEEALERIIELQPSLVVLDVMMPGLSGWEICKYVRSRATFEGTKVLMLTAIGKTVNEMTSPLYGADASLDKPFNLEEIVRISKDLLAAALT